MVIPQLALVLLLELLLVLDRIGRSLLRHLLSDLLLGVVLLMMMGLGDPTFGRGGRGLPVHREVVDERTPPLAFDLPEVAGVDHQQRLVAAARGRLGLVGQLVLHAAVHVERTRIVLLHLDAASGGRGRGCGGRRRHCSKGRVARRRRHDHDVSRPTFGPRLRSRERV